MKKLKFDDTNLLEFGNTLQIGGVIFSGRDESLICLFPEESAEDNFSVLELNDDEWKKIIRQTDLQETEILSIDKNGKLAKTIIRKTTRVIEQGVSWRVYQRDGYKCRYCAKEGIPMTVDHLVLWEDGGPSIEENLVTACRKCNKVRGSIQYTEWLKHPRYIELSKSLTQEVKDLNLQLVNTLDSIPLRIHKRNR